MGNELIHLTPDAMRHIPTVIRMTWDLVPCWTVLILGILVLLLAGCISILWAFRDKTRVRGVDRKDGGL